MKTFIIFFVAIAATAQDQAIPPELVGTWSYTETSATMFRDRATGAFARPSGSSSTFEFHSDGSFKNWDLIQQSMYNCTETVFITQTGHLKVDGGAMMLAYEAGHVSSKDNCNARFNYEKDAKPDVKTYDAWTIRMSPNGPQLLMASGGKLKLVYTRKKE